MTKTEEKDILSLIADKSAKVGEAFRDVFDVEYKDSEKMRVCKGAQASFLHLFFTTGNYLLYEKLETRNLHSYYNDCDIDVGYEYDKASTYTLEEFVEKYKAFTGTLENKYDGADISRVVFYTIGIYNNETGEIVDVKNVRNIINFIKSFSSPELDYDKLAEIKDAKTRFGLIYEPEKYRFFVFNRISVKSKSTIDFNCFIGNTVLQFLSDNNRLSYYSQKEADLKRKQALEAYEAKERG